MAMRARDIGIFALSRSSNGTASIEFVNLGSKAAINIRQCEVLKTRPAELRRTYFVGRPLREEVYKLKLQPIAFGRAKHWNASVRG
jgi:hypothetical protein